MDGKEIKILRERLQESQETFGERFGVSYATIGRWERGLRRPLPAFQKMLQKLLKDNPEVKNERNYPQG